MPHPQITTRPSGKPAPWPNRIRAFRLRAGWSQADLGFRTGHPRKVISHWERGHYFPTGPHVFQLAHAFGIHAEDLLWPSVPMESTQEGRAQALDSRPSEEVQEEIPPQPPTTPIVSATLDPPPTILGIEPGSRVIGLARLFDGKLVSVGVYTLRNEHAPHDPMVRAERILSSALAQYQPQIVAIRTPGSSCRMRRAVIEAFLQRLAQMPSRPGVRQFAFQEIGQVILGNPKATKLAIAEALVERGFEELRSKLPKRPARSALGFRAGERYWFHAFNALAVAVTAEKLHWDAIRFSPSVHYHEGSSSAHGQPAS